MTQHPPILKKNWERLKAHFDLNSATLKQLIQPFSNRPIHNFTLLSEGCANTNYKIEFENAAPVVLRIYMRDQSSLAREIALYDLVKNSLPVPEILYSDDSATQIEHPYAITSFIEGELMRNVVLMRDQSVISECTFSAGLYLNHLRQTTFAKGGFFQDNQLRLRPFDPEEEYLTYAQNCLNHENVIETLGVECCDQLRSFLNLNQNLFPDKNSANLTHADYDPANLLVRKIDGHYQVVGILDWEFAFAGSYLLDMGLFLRYSHRLPQIYESSFIQGLCSEGQSLPTEWKKIAKLMDVVSLLSLLVWNSNKERSQLCQDVRDLLQHTLNSWQG